MKRMLGVLVLLLSAGVVSAQVDRATLSGTVKDQSGGVLSTATVSVTNVATKVASRARTTSEGSYFVNNLISGQYLVEVEAAGFQTKADSIILDVGQRARLDVTLGVGTLTEAVTVEEPRHLLNTEQAALGTVIDQTSVAKLPLAIRNWDDLLALVPGVQGDRFTEQGGGTSFGRTGGINVHGARALQNNFLLDGVDNNSISENVQELTSQVSRPSVDAIQEFKVVTSPYSAEYGRTPGAAISVTTKSGTNAIHGTLYDFYRNDKFDSNDYFSLKAHAPKPANDQNQFGANIGGPIIKDKAFFFGDYEGTRITRGVTRITSVPTADMRAGRFPSAIKDPLTGQPFPGNVIPANRIDPIAAGILSLVPLPNQEGANNFFRQADLTDNNDRFLGRFDAHLSQNDSVFTRYIHSNRQRDIPGAFGGVVDGTGTSAFGNQSIKTDGIVAGWTRIFSSSIVNEFRFSWLRSKSDAVHQAFGVAPPPNATVPGVTQDPLIAGGLPGITIDGFFGGSGLGRLGSPDFLPKFQHTRQFEYLDTLSWLMNDHQLKFGVDILQMKNQYLDVPAIRGSLRFRNRFTGNPLADYLLGYVSDFQLSNSYVVDQRHWASMFFVQDDWKVNSRLTVNMGLRYDFITPALEAQDRQTNVLLENGGQLIFAKGGSLEDRGLVKPDRNNFAPRVGFVYKVDEKTLVRGGYGIFYNLFDRVGSEDQLALNVPGLINTSVSSSATSPLFFLQGGYPAGFLTPPRLDPAAGDLKRLRLRAVDQNAPKTTINQASVGFQRELMRNVVLSVDGIYTKGTNLASLVNINQPANGGGALPYPNFGFIEWRAQDAKSSYKGVDVGIERRFSGGYGFGVAYTYGNSKDNSSEQLTTQGSNAFPQDANNFDAWYGPSDYDVKHRLAVNFVAELPFGEGKKWATSGVGSTLFGGWTLAGIYAQRTGRPFTVNQSSNNVGQNMTGLPDLVGDPKGAETVAQWFNPAAFKAVTSGTFGNEHRNGLRGPGFHNVDLSLQRRIGFGSRYSATFRWDVFNVFNTVNFGLPNRNLSDSTVGTITTLAGDPRLMQFSLRFGF